MNEILLCLFWLFVGFVAGATRERILTDKVGKGWSINNKTVFEDEE